MTAPAEDRPDTEQKRARPARDPRLLARMIYTPVLLAVAGLLCWWAAGSGPDGRNSLSLVAAVCLVLAVVAAAQAAGLLRRAHHRGPQAH